MQRTYKKALCSLIAVIILSVAFAVLRVILMTKNFDALSGFFINKTPATVLYLSLLAFVVIIFCTSKSIRILPSVASNKAEAILSAVSAAAFILIAISCFGDSGDETQINKIATGVASVFAILSEVYYFLKIVTKNTFTAFLSVSPFIFFLAHLIDYFVAISGHANTYYLFPDFFSLLVLVYFLLTLGRIEHLNLDAYPIFSVSLITICTLSFSLLPDIYLLLSGASEFAMLPASIGLFKLINLVLAVCIAVSVTKRIKEENK